ncbi:MAG TPA: ABC transporter permease [Chloroflexi bacterium]|nr:ABC transporter permease [Chloroflexota bacterium]
MTNRRIHLIFMLLAVLVALLFTSLVLVIAGASPVAAYWHILKGSLGSWTNIANVMVAWVPLLLATSGLLVTFAAGLWNIGIEGQIVLGGIFTTWVLRLLQHSTMNPALILALAITAGALGGALWSVLAGLLKVYGGVNEIFGGLGLDFVAVALTLWLIFGPWKRPGIGSMSGTEPFPEKLWLPTVAGSRLSLWALLIGLVGAAVVYFLLSGTYFGLKLKAVGKNPRAAHLLGIPTTRYLMSAFLLSGLFAGLAGAVQVTAVYHRLIPAISSGYGWLGLMVSMLINFQPAWVAPVTLFFAILNIGSIQLPIVLKLDSSLSGVLQGALVLSFLLMAGVRQRWQEKHEQEVIRE